MAIGNAELPIHVTIGNVDLLIQVAIGNAELPIHLAIGNVKLIHANGITLLNFPLNNITYSGFHIDQAAG